MTKEELEKLAKIAGVRVKTVFGDLCCWNLESWKPDESLEQAFLVEEGIPQHLRGKYLDQLLCVVGPSWSGWGQVHATAKQRCQAALRI